MPLIDFGRYVNTPIPVHQDTEVTIRRPESQLETTDYQNKAAAGPANPFFLILVPPGEVWEILGIDVSWFCSAVVGTRVFNCRIQDNKGYLLWEGWYGPMVASEAHEIAAVPGGDYVAPFALNGSTQKAGSFPLPVGLTLVPGNMILFRDTAAIDRPGDTLFQAVLYNKRVIQ